MKMGADGNEGRDGKSKKRRGKERRGKGGKERNGEGRCRVERDMEVKEILEEDG